ncbi:hypothetical protein Lfu02_11300 [Longispora fulva]|uniref:Chitodextrinase n=1 Tax=Longispora fulva TaxID=619741 RepID=A0A8J7GFJ7_9ACTN|nr:S8 family serine peptidase [Longispora fulva]MBG6135008.1 chitodextrinase [Longispora fulva]GIG56758.1 hypothetical protein Lfu02_11300 [Longispora fulva]
MKRIALFAGMTLAIAGVMATPAAAQEPSATYVVVLTDSAPDPATVAGGVAGLRLGSVYRSALRGFSAQLTPGAVTALRADPRVAYVEPNKVGHADGQAVANGVSRTLAAGNAALRIGDGRDERVDVDVAVLDTGVDQNHPDLNVVHRVNCLNTTSCVDNAGTDDNGHGSNVAGIVGELDNGVGYVGMAPGARLWSVKVLDKEGSGDSAGIVAGIDWVTAHAADIEVANISIGFDGTVQAVNDAVNRAIARGVVVVVSAGNDHRDVSHQSPANVADAITVSSLSDGDGQPGGTGNFAWCNSNNKNRDDTLSDYSNFGAGVDLAAPGDCIRSTFANGGYSNYSGTSQAAPHVAGAAAWLASGANKPSNRAGVLAIRDKLVNAGNLSWTDTSGDGTKERLLDLHDPAVFPPGGAGGPSASFAPTCDNDARACTFDASASTGAALSYSWDFGDGATGTGVKPSHTYAAYGTYTVKLTVTDDTGRTGTNSTQIRLSDPAVNDRPLASFTRFCATNLCFGDATASTDPDGTIASYMWTFGDGGTATGVKPSHTYPARTATYRVTLTVTDNRGATATATADVSCTQATYFTQCTVS